MRSIRMKAAIAALACITLPTSTMAVVAGDPTVLPGGTQVGQPGQGSDIYTQVMTQLGLFTAHRNTCDDTGQSPSEVFVEVYTDDNSVAFGFCIDKNEHSAGSVNWENARDECMEDGKRLPEPGEMLQALNTVSASMNSTGEDHEWSTNFTNSDQYVGAGSSITATTIKSSSVAGFGYVGAVYTTPTSVPFRCVR